MFDLFHGFDGLAGVFNPAIELANTDKFVCCIQWEQMVINLLFALTDVKASFGFGPETIGFADLAVVVVDLGDEVQSEGSIVESEVVEDFDDLNWNGKIGDFGSFLLDIDDLVENSYGVRK